MSEKTIPTWGYKAGGESRLFELGEGESLPSGWFDNPNCTDAAPAAPVGSGSDADEELTTLRADNAALQARIAELEADLETLTAPDEPEAVQSYDINTDETVTRLPDGWRELQWKQRVKLAEQLTGERFANAASADEALEALEAKD